MTTNFKYPTAPNGHFFKIKQYTDEWSYETFWTLQLRRRAWIFSYHVDSLHLPALHREAVAEVAKELLARHARREAYQELADDVPTANKILKRNNK